VVAAAARDGALLLYDRNGTMLWEERITGEPSALALSANGTALAAGSDEGTVYLFETGVTPEPTPTKAPRGRTNATSGRNVTGANAAPEVNAGDLAVTGNLTVGGNLTVTGDLRARGAVTAGGTITAGSGPEDDGARAANLTGEEDGAPNLTAPGEDRVTEAATPEIDPEEEVSVGEDGTVFEVYETIYIEDDETISVDEETDLVPSDEENLTDTEEPAVAPSTPRDGAAAARTVGDLVVPGNYTVEGDLTVGGDVRAAGNLTVGGTLTAATNRSGAGNATATVAAPVNRTPVRNRTVEANATPVATPFDEAQAPWIAGLPWDGAGNATPATGSTPSREA
jgi:cytoskeletal protein CcmA (bactofilin family)